MKSNLFLIIVLFCINTVFAEDVTFTVEIHDVTVNRGTIILGFYSSERSFTNENPDISFQLNPTDSIISYEIVLPEGEYMIGIHQDLNGNGVMDYGLFRFPKEPYAFSKMKGKIPGNFNQSKTRIDNLNNRIIMSLVMFSIYIDNIGRNNYGGFIHYWFVLKYISWIMAFYSTLFISMVFIHSK